MNILVTGSAGRVGSAVVGRLLEKGYRARGLDLRPSGRDHDRFSEVVGTVDNPGTAQQALRGIEVVLHLGAFMSWDPKDRSKLFQANVEGTRVLLEAAAGEGVRRFVFASSGEVYPETNPERLPITEDHPLNANSVYGLTKLMGEELVRFHQRTGTLETVILRFSHTQDARELLDEDSFFSGPRFFLRPRIRQQESFGNKANADILRAADPGSPAHVLARSEHGRPYQMHITDTRDMVRGVLLAMEKTEAVGRVFNLGADSPVDFETLLERMSRITGYPVVTVDLPGAGVYYQTSNELVRETLGYETQWTIDRMLEEAAETWKTGRTG